VAFQREDRRSTVCAIDGMAGVGKTALAVHAAHGLVGDFTDGQIFVDLHAHTAGHPALTGTEALRALLLASGVDIGQIPMGLQERALMWRRRLTDGRWLLVLDNAVNGEQVLPLLPATPGSLTLITSRRRLSTLDTTVSISLDPLSRQAATILFTNLIDNRAEADPEDQNSVRHVITLCGALPLAIRLVAGQLRHHPTWSTAHVAEQLANSHNRPAEIHGDDRQLEAIFALSYRMLGADEARLFRRLGLHPGTDITADAAAALDGIEVATARGRLLDLYSHHLIEEPNSPGRYQFHDLLAEYARSLAYRHDQASERDAAITRLLTFYVTALDHADRTRNPWKRRPALPPAPAACELPAFDGPSRARAWLEDEQENLFACGLLAADQGHPYNSHIIRALLPHLRAAGATGQARRLTYAAVQSARRRHHHEDEACALAALGDTEWYADCYDRALDCYQQARGIYQATGNRAAQADILTGLGQIHRLMGHCSLAREAFDHAAELYLQLDHQGGQGDVRYGLAHLERTLGNHTQARNHYQDALGIYQAIQDDLGQANALTGLAHLALTQGDLDPARDLFEKALALYRTLGSHGGIADALCGLGDLERSTGRHEQARTALIESLQISQTTNDQRGQADALSGLGHLALAAEQHDTAATAFNKAMEIFRTIHDRRGTASTFIGQGHLMLATDRHQQAHAHFTHAMKIFHEIGDIAGSARATAGLGFTSWLTGDHSEAERHLRNALNAYMTTGDRAGQAAVLLTLGQIARQQNRQDEATNHVQRAATLLDRFGCPLPYTNHDGSARTDQHTDWRQTGGLKPNQPSTQRSD
jgi:tetratricopeptide (TPR) repeat protein